MPELKIPTDDMSLTAFCTAWARYEESEQPRPLFTDPLADFLIPEFEKSPALVASIARMRATASGFAAYNAVRTRFFDDQIERALDEGVRQVVGLAAGVDGRAVRLPCPPGTRWFELDLPHMTEFKTTLVEQSALPLTCERIGVAADMRTDWLTPLRAAGFDPTQPTAWLVEGLLMHLAPEKGDALLAAISASSVPGSRLFLEQLQSSALGANEEQSYDDPAGHVIITLRAARDDIEDWLGAAGWQANVYAGDDPAISYGRAVAPVPACWLASAARAAS